MDILILSDSHGHPERVEEAVRRARPDVLLFAGDGVRDLEGISFPGRVYAVRGNCDWGVIGDGYADEELITLAGVRILLMHGHRWGVKSGLGAALAHAQTCAADVLIFGHTHEATEMHLSTPHPRLLINPGSLGDYTRAFATLTLRDGQMLCGRGAL